MPSAVFMSVIFLPFVRVTVDPVESEPPEMPTLAVVLDTDTSWNTGSAAGKVAPALTTSVSPLTEILAEVRLADEGVEGEADAGGGGGVGPGGSLGVTGAGGGALTVFACWMNGSLLEKRSKERSCPLPACAAGSESESVAPGRTGIETGVPGTAPGGGATGVTGAGVAAAAGGFLFMIFKTEGTW